MKYDNNDNQYSNTRLMVDGYITYTDVQEDLDTERDYVISYWNAFLEANDKNIKLNNDYYIHERNLFEVIRRLGKREVYYKVFHKLPEINELKRTAILCYWINTLKPFMVVNPDSPLYNSPNETFSMYLIMSVIRSLYAEIYPNKKFEYPTDAHVADMVYNFKYCDLSREATISFVETFADNYGVGIGYIINNINAQKEERET
ncbi:MAG: hypothetical protein J1F01_00805 [Oscillospiraceae bacterium]|nr:hypothetical protein [Oscillospiraceae bacterium]